MRKEQHQKNVIFFSIIEPFRAAHHIRLPTAGIANWADPKLAENAPETNRKGLELLRSEVPVPTLLIFIHKCGWHAMQHLHSGLIIAVHDSCLQPLFSWNGRLKGMISRLWGPQTVVLIVLLARIRDCESQQPSREAGACFLCRITRKFCGAGFPYLGFVAVQVTAKGPTLPLGCPRQLENCANISWRPSAFAWELVQPLSLGNHKHMRSTGVDFWGQV